MTILTNLSMPAIIVSDYTVLPTDKVLRYDSSGGIINFQLPDPTLGRRELIFINVLQSGSGNGINLVRFASEKIQNVTSTKFVDANSILTTLYSDLVNYFTGSFPGAIPVVTPNVVGSIDVPEEYDGTTAIPFSGDNPKNIIYLKSTGGVVVLSDDPQIEPGSYVGQELELIFTSDSDTVELNNGTGLDLPAKFISKDKRRENLQWNGTNWSERFRI